MREITGMWKPSLHSDGRKMLTTALKPWCYVVTERRRLTTALKPLCYIVTVAILAQGKQTGGFSKECLFRPFWVKDDPSSFSSETTIRDAPSQKFWEGGPSLIWSTLCSPSWSEKMSCDVKVTTSWIVSLCKNWWCVEVVFLLPGSLLSQVGRRLRRKGRMIQISWKSMAKAFEWFKEFALLRLAKSDSEHQCNVL